MLSSSTLATVPARERFVTGLLTLTQDTTLAVSWREQVLLRQFVQGELSLEQLLLQLEGAQQDPAVARAD